MRNLKYFLLLCLSFTIYQVRAQTWMNLRSAHIFGGSNYEAVVPMGNFSGTSNYWANNSTTPIQLKVVSNTFISKRNIVFNFPIDNVGIQINDIGGQIPGSSGFQGTFQPVKPLSTSPIDLFIPQGGLLANRPRGVVNMKLRIPNSAIASTKWLQGEYINMSEYTTYISGPLRFFTPVVDYYYLEIDAILNWLVPPVVTSHNVPSSVFDLFRNPEGLKLSIEGTLGTTMPFKLYLRSTANSILKNGVPLNPSIPLSSVVVSGTDIKSGTVFDVSGLSAAERDLKANSLFSIGSANRNPLRYNLSISQEQLKLYYFSPGTYSIPALRLKETATAVATSWNEAGGLKTKEDDVAAFSFIVPELQQIRINGSPDVFFNFNSIQSYQEGAIHEITKELNISSNVNYTVYVKAESNAFRSAGTATIPLNVLQLGPLTGNTDVRTISLSNTSQILIPSSAPVLDRKVNIKYSIPLAKAKSDIFGKRTGNYKTNVVYSFIAN